MISAEDRLARCSRHRRYARRTSLEEAPLKRCVPEKHCRFVLTSYSCYTRRTIQMLHKHPWGDALAGRTTLQPRTPRISQAAQWRPTPRSQAGGLMCIHVGFVADWVRLATTHLVRAPIEAAELEVDPAPPLPASPPAGVVAWPGRGRRCCLMRLIRDSNA